MTKRAFGGFAAAIVLALAVVGFVPRPALARAPGVAITSPTNGATLDAPVSIAGQASMQNGDVDWASLTIESAEDHPVPAAKTFAGNDSGQLPFTWSAPIAYNGHYKVIAQAQGSDNFDFNGPEISTVAHDFTLNVPPASPGGVKAVVNQTKRTVTISWAKNPEPDLVGYGVYRESGDKLVDVGILKPNELAITDNLGSLPAGTYAYQVIAVRLDASGEGFLPSAPAKTSGKVTSSPPTTTTSTGGTGTVGATTTTTAPGAKGPTLATRGRADLSGFAALLPSGGAKLPAATRSPAPDPGFEEDLPFDPDAPAEDEPAVGRSDQALAEEPLSSSDDNEPSSLRFMAAGLLVTVVLMHLLWLRDEVNRDPLPAIAPEEPVEA